MEIEREKAGQPHKQIIKQCSSSLIAILLAGLQKINEDEEDKFLKDENDSQEWTVCLAATCALENMALVMKDEILSPVLHFIQPKLASNLWVDKYVGILAFGAILEGPSPATIISNISQAFESIIGFIADETPIGRAHV